MGWEKGAEGRRWLERELEQEGLILKSSKENVF